MHLKTMIKRNLMLAAAAFAGSALAGRRNLVVEKDGDTLYLTVGPKGFVLLAR